MGLCNHVIDVLSKKGGCVRDLSLKGAIVTLKKKKFLRNVRDFSSIPTFVGTCFATGPNLQTKKPGVSSALSMHFKK
jgi:hypothetical protein